MAAGYEGRTNVPNGPRGTITGPGGTCVAVAADDTGVNGTAVQLRDCQSSAIDQHGQHVADNTLRTLGRCLDIVGNGVRLQIYDGNAGAAQKFALS